MTEYDYSTGGYYFITACAKDKQCIFGTAAGRGILEAPYVELSSAGKQVESALSFLNTHSKDICVDKYVIMPNHIHMILIVKENCGASRCKRPTNAGIPMFLSSLKRYTNRQMGQNLWQTGYYDHIIRNEEDYLRIWQYIDGNPAKWEEDKYFDCRARHP